MATLASLLGTLGGIASSTAKARQELSAEDLRKKQIRSQLESEALNRKQKRAALDRVLYPHLYNPYKLQRDQMREAGFSEEQINQMFLGKAAGKTPVEQWQDIRKQFHEDTGRYPTADQEAVFFKLAPKPGTQKTYKSVVMDPTSPTGASYIVATPDGRVLSRMGSAPVPRGMIYSQSITTDQYGNRVITDRRPVFNGGLTKQPTILPSPREEMEGAETPAAAATTPVPATTAAPTRLSDLFPSSSAKPPVQAKPAKPSPARQIVSAASKTPLGRRALDLADKNAPYHLNQVGRTADGRNFVVTGFKNGHPLVKLLPQPAAESKKPSPLARKSLQLDPSGHIPDSPMLNPQIREAANQLIDGVDLKDLPPRAKETAASLARKYGWYRGWLPPADRRRMEVNRKFINEMMSDGSLNVLNSKSSRAKLIASGVLLTLNRNTGGVEKVAQNEMQSILASTLTPDEQRFRQQYNRLVGIISGMSQAVRGGRPTEASVSRLMSELPGPQNAANAKDGYNTLHLLVQEIDTMLEPGYTLPEGRPEKK